MYVEPPLELVTYQGRQVPRKGFRVFVYGKNDTKKLVNSFDEFESHIQSGNWYERIEELQDCTPIQNSVKQFDEVQKAQKKARK